MINSSPARSTFTVGSDVEVRFKGAADNAKCAVDQWAIKLGGKFFLANLILPHAAPDGARWLFGSLATSAGDPVWSYRDDKRVLAGFDGHVFTVVEGEATYLVYATKGKVLRVVHTVPLIDILQQHEVETSLDVSIRRKQKVAEQLGCEPELTPAESVVVHYLAAQARAEEEARRRADAEAREAARQAKVEAILARKHVRVYAGGKSVEAIWVVEGEWQMLPPRTEVILGEIRDDKKFYPMETFTVFKDFKKRGSAPEKSRIAVVGHEPTPAAATRLPEPTASRVVMLDGKPFAVPSFARVDDIQAHRAAGLNSGVLRGVVEEGGFTLFRVRKDGLEQVAAGTFTVIG